MSRKPATHSIRDCRACGKTIVPGGPRQIYCKPCSFARDLQRKREWSQANPQQNRAPRDPSAMVAAGAITSIDNRAPVAWRPDADLCPRVVVRVAVPFDYAFSKNAVWRTGRGGHIYARQESNAARDALAMALKPSADKFVQGKIWVDIFVEKPNHRGDAINVVDVVCDGVKDGLGIDDRWYSIRRLDWSIVKESPRILVGVSQEVQAPQQVCSHCGRQLDLGEFGKNASTATGRSRVCRDCSAPKRGRRAA